MMAAGQFEQRSAERIAALERLPSAVLFVDVVDSVRLVETDEVNAVGRWLGFIEELEIAVLPDGNGRIVKTLGDGLLLEFSDIAGAVRVAFEIKDRLAILNRDLARDMRIEVRMGLNTGDVIRGADQDIFGHSVNIASRLMDLGKPGQIIASAEVRDALADEPNAEFEDLGDCYLKNVKEPVRAFLIHPRGFAPPIVPLLSAEDLLPTVAVVPFTPHSRALDHFILGEVLAEDIIGALSRSAEMNVISRLSTTGFRLRPRSLGEIGDALNADFVISGVYSGDDKRVILDLELAEVRSGLVVWTRRISDDVSNLLQSDTELSEIAVEVHRAIVKTEMRRALSNPMPTLEGYTLLMASVTLMHRLSPRDFAMAGELLETLIERSPNIPGPLAWMARWHVLKVQQGWTETPQREAKLAMDCTRQALDLDPSNVQALVAEGFTLNNLLHRLDESEDRYDTALELSPNDASGRLMRGTLFAFRGEGAAAMRETERAMHLAPLDPHRFFHQALAAGACVAAESYQRALELANRSWRLNRTHTSTLRVKAVAEMRLGKGDEAKRTARELLRLQPGLTVSGWMKSAPSANFQVGRDFADTMREIGIPE